MALIVAEGHGGMRNQKTSALFLLEISKLIWMKCSRMPQLLGLLKFMFEFGLHNYIQGRKLYLDDFI